MDECHSTCCFFFLAVSCWLRSLLETMTDEADDHEDMTTLTILSILFGIAKDQRRKAEPTPDA